MMVRARLPGPSRRSSWRVARIALAAVLVSTAGFAAVDLAGPPPAQAQSSDPGGGKCSGGWRRMALPSSAQASRPLDVISHAGKLAWIVGGGKEGVVLLERTPGGWLSRRTLTARLAGLSAGVGTGPSSVLAVGYDWLRETNILPIGGIYAGGWDQQRVPRPRDPHAALADVEVTPSGGAWAVGSRLSSGRSRPLVLQWNGSRWSRKDPDLGRVDSATVAVTRAPDGSVWTVGWQAGPEGRWRPLIARREGSAWQEIEGAVLPEGSVVLTDVDFARGDRGWATGYLIEAGTSRHQPILQRWDGVEWSLEELPWADDMSVVPRALSVTRDGSIWIAGTRLETPGREARGFMAHRDGASGTWQLSSLGLRAGARSEMLSMAATRDGAVASGVAAGAAIVIRSCRGATAAEPGVEPRESRVALGSLRLPSPAATVGGGGEGGEPMSPRVRVRAGASVPLPAPVAARGFVIRDVAARVGLASRTVTYGGLAADLNGDGRMDIFYSRHAREPRVALGTRRGFRVARRARFGPVDRHGCAAADIDQDGQMDIFCSAGRGRGSAMGRHEVSLRPATRESELARDALGAADPFGRGRLAAFMDLEGDGWPDLFIANVPARTDGMPASNRFFRNVEGRFVSAPEVGLDRSVGGACLWTGDLDGDGDDDLVHCVEYADDRRPPGVRVFINDDGTLIERSDELGIQPIGDVDALMADVNGDGRLDLVQLGPRNLRVSHQTDSGFERVYQARVPGGVALAAGDVDGDGRADVYILRAGKNDRPDLLLVAREGGRSFVSVRIPQASFGRGDDVVALDYDGNGLTDFLVLNGWNTPGPIQLLASMRRRR